MPSDVFLFLPQFLIPLACLVDLLDEVRDVAVPASRCVAAAELQAAFSQYVPEYKVLPLSVDVEVSVFPVGNLHSPFRRVLADKHDL